MTEAEWRACREPRPMLQWLQASGRLSDRKLRLFAVAWASRHWCPDTSTRRALDVASQFAEGDTGLTELSAAHAIASTSRATNASLVAAATHPDVAQVLHLLQAQRPGWAESEALAELLRHIVNPFLVLPPVPSEIVHLAEAFGAGAFVHFALYDALTEADLLEPAAHFRFHRWHPQGCAWLDALAGKA